MGRTDEPSTLRPCLALLVVFIATLSGCMGGASEKAASSTPPGASNPAASTANASNTAPHAAMELRQSDAVLGLQDGVASASSAAPVDFAANGTVDADDDRLEFTWSFGDGATAQGAFASHSYEAGLYRVELWVTDGRGGNGTANLTLNVSASGSKAPYEKYSHTGTLTMVDNATNYATSRQGAYSDKFFPVKEGAKLVYVVMTYTQAPNVSNVQAVDLDLNVFNGKGERKWQQTDDDLPQVLKIPEAEILSNGLGTWKAQASCKVCAQTGFSFEVRVYYQVPA